MTVAVLTAPARAAAVHWETSLFSSAAAPRPEVMSVRAAYQLVLHRRAVLVDIRTRPERQAAGDVHPGLRPVTVDDASGDVERRFGPGDRVVVLDADGSAAGLTAAALARRGVDAVAVVGGIGSWRAAGLPTA